MAEFGIAIKAGIVKDDRLLVLYKAAAEASDDADPLRRLDLPGGRLEFGEQPLGALRREIDEEVGITAQPVQPAAVWTTVKGGFQLVGITYYCRFVSGEVRLSPEHVAHEWLTLPEIAGHTTSDVEDMVAVLELHRLLGPGSARRF